MAQYRFETAKEDYSHYSSGRVFASAPGITNFPVRLASEIFQACVALLPEEMSRRRLTLYDPCCGAGYLLATLAYRHWERLNRIIGSDADPDALAIARRNLAMITREGLLSKLEFLRGAQAEEPRESREEAMLSVEYFLERLAVLGRSHPLETSVFQADAGCAKEIEAGMKGGTADVVIADIPYGGLARWQGRIGEAPSRDAATSTLLESIRLRLSTGAVVAIVSPKGDSAAHPAFQRRRRLKFGKRLVTFLSLPQEHRTTR